MCKNTLLQTLNIRIVVNKMFKYVHMNNKYQMKYGEMQNAVIFVLREVRLEIFLEKFEISARARNPVLDDVTGIAVLRSMT